MFRDENQFTIYLPSSGRSYLYPKNSSPGNYITKLKDRIQLEPDEWVVGLFSIDYRVSWKLFDKPQQVVIGVTTKEDGKTVSIHEASEQNWFYEKVTDEREYVNIEELLNEINKVLPGSTNRKLCKFVFDETSNRVQYKIINAKNINIIRIDISNELAKALGFTNTHFSRKLLSEAKYAPRLTRNIERLYIGTDLIRPNLVGDDHVKLLRVVNINEHMLEYDKHLHEEFNHILYYPLYKSSFNTIKITISNENGKITPFRRDDDVLLVLHFRRKGTFPTYT